MNKTLSRGLMACLSLVALASCQDYDGGFDEGQIKKAAYAKHFEDTFGKIDPNQDWSMAQQVTANVSGVEDGMLEIYYSDPIGGKPMIIAKRQIVNGKASLKFDVVKGTKQIFARINDGKDYYSLKSNFQIVNGQVNICPSLTRATILTDPCRVTRGDAQTIVSSQVFDKSKEPKAEIRPWADMANWYLDGCYSTADGQGNVTYLVNGDYLKEGSFTNVYYLNNVINTADERPEWYYKDIAHFFTEVDGEPAVFKEAENHVNYMKEGSRPHFERDLVFTMEENGPFYLDYFAKGTQYDNQFGYFYFTGDNPTPEEFMTMPKFVMVKNMSTTGGKIKVDEDMHEISWNLLQTKSPTWQPGQNLGSSDGNKYEDTGIWDTKLVGTRFQLVYWGADGLAATGTYTFPKDTKIGLFIIGNVNDSRNNEFITSISSINLELFNEYPHAASFRYNDQVVFAMEDQRFRGDADVNDVMFIANGSFKKDEIPVINPIIPEFPTWIIACEDLGGSFDYDFNDVVLGLRKEDKGNGKSDLYLVPLAAGGTLEANVTFNGGPVGEIHGLVKSGSSTSVPLNVHAGNDPGAGNAIRIAADVDADKSINEYAELVNIHVVKGDDSADNNGHNIGYHYKQDGYTAPEVLILQPGWDWPDERTFICDIYPDFEDWAGDVNETGWYAKKAGATAYYKNPIPEVVPAPTPGGSGGSGSEQPSTPVTGSQSWDITVSGYDSMEKNSTQTLTITIDGDSDYSKLTFGTYSTSVISAAKGDANNKVTITAGSNLGTALLWVKMPGDANHKDTYLTYEITVTHPTPVYTPSIVGATAQEGVYTLTVGTSELYVDVTGANGAWDKNCIVISSDNEDVIAVNGNINYNRLEIKSPGDANIIVKHSVGSPVLWKETEVKIPVHVVAAGGSGGGGSSITPSGATTYTGDALSALLSDTKYILPSTVCQTATACTIKITSVGTPFYGNSNYVQFKLYVTGRSGGPVQDFTEISSQYNTFDRSDVTTATVYEFHAEGSAFTDINTSGITLENNSGTISKIEIVAE
ncbi:MAG: LruC domain-containing protein [Prevotellaceae bacterium]|nr:LruC domain-containing protein [Candidatus Colivivens equi]